MKTLELKCPGCGAAIRIRNRSKDVTCEYCRKRVFISDSEWAGLGPDEELIEKIQSLIQPVIKLEQSQKRLNMLTSQRKVLQEKFQTAHSFSSRIGAYIWPVLTAVFLCGAGVSGGSFATVLIGLVAAAALFLFMRADQKKKHANIENGIDDVNQQLRAVRSDIDSIYQNNDITLIPEEYRTEDAIRFINSALVNEKAYTLTQAITQYEDNKNAELHELQTRQYETRIHELKVRQEELENENKKLSEKKDKSGIDIDKKDVLNAVTAVGTIAAVAWRIGRRKWK